MSSPRLLADSRRLAPQGARSLRVRVASRSVLTSSLLAIASSPCSHQRSPSKGLCDCPRAFGPSLHGISVRPMMAGPMGPGSQRIQRFCGGHGFRFPNVRCFSSSAHKGPAAGGPGERQIERGESSGRLVSPSAEVPQRPRDLSGVPEAGGEPHSPVILGARRIHRRSL